MVSCVGLSQIVAYVVECMYSRIVYSRIAIANCIEALIDHVYGLVASESIFALFATAAITIGMKSAALCGRANLPHYAGVHLH